MNNLLKRFYFLSKLTTSLVLLSVLLFLGYLFLKVYLVEDNDLNAISELTQELKIISSTVERNSNNLNVIEDTINNNNKSFNEITSIIDNVINSEPNKDLLIQIKKLFSENELLKNEISNLSMKINSLNNQNQELVTNVEENFPVHNLVNLIKLKMESGTSVVEEIELLHNLNHNDEKKTYITKLQILSNKHFIGLNKLNKNFDKITSEYLNFYYLKNNNNNFIKYLSGIVSIQPNFNGDIEDETIKHFVMVKNRLTEKDIEGALNHLLLINKSEIFFQKWINEANYFIKFDKTLDKILD